MASRCGGQRDLLNDATAARLCPLRVLIWSYVSVSLVVALRKRNACAPWRGFENPDLWLSNRAARRGVIQGLLSKGTRLLFNVNVCIGCADCSFKAYAGQRKEELPLNVSGAAPNCFLLFSFFELRWIFTFKSQIVRIALIGYFNFLYQLKGHNCLYIYNLSL